MNRKIHIGAYMALVAGLGACASVDFDHPRVESFAFTDTADTRIGRNVAGWGVIPEGHGGFHLLRDSVDALSARLVLAQRAERSIDAQYYLAYADLVGYLCVEALLAAADRGVRVRLLLDDFLTGGLAAGLVALDSHPNVEVRLYNPFARRKFRLGDFATSFSRVNRRMHNKVFIVDNQATLIGGRNIAEEYFGASDNVNFGDVDVLGIGPVVADTSRMFDEYWNHRISVPIHALVDAPKDPAAAVAALRHRTSEVLADIDSTPYGAALSGSALQYLEHGVDDISWAPYEFVYDPPVKPTKKEGEEGAASILTPLRGSINASEEELIVVSPYFVLPSESIERLGAFEDRGVNVRVVTNSLASNNHAMVHSGYAPTRKPLLKEGAEIYEARPDARVSGVDPDIGSKTTLHTKAFIVDRRWTFLGSFNWDPRSAYINTESGIIIDDREIAEGIAELIDRAIPTASYTVFLDEKDRVRWKTTNADGEVVVFTREPETGAWTRFKVRVMSMLPLEGQL